METKEISVLNMESLKVLSLPTQKLIKEISKELKLDALEVFNPIVEAMVVVEEYKSIKYDANNPETVEKYKTAKKEIGHFNSKTKNTKTILKKDILEVGKKLDAIEKVFLDRAKVIMEHILIEFKPYLDEQEKLKKEKEERKNASTIAKITEMSKESVQQKLVIERMNLKQKIDSELTGYVPDAVNKAKTFSKSALAKEIEELEELKEVGYNLNESEIAILLADQQEEIKSLFTSNIDSAITVLQMAYDKPEPLPQIPLNQIEVNTPLQVIAPSITQENPNYFKTVINNILEASIVAIEKLNPATERENNVKTGTLKSLRNSQNKITEYLS